jgi:hypothetical protein
MVCDHSLIREWIAGSPLKKLSPAATTRHRCLLQQNLSKAAFLWSAPLGPDRFRQVNLLSPEQQTHVVEAGKTLEAVAGF